MRHDYEDIFDTDDLDDDELRALVYQTLRDDRSIDPAEIKVRAQDGIVTLSGRVGTDEERRIALRIVADRIGLERVLNHLIVDSARRAHNSEAADESDVETDADAGLLLGGKPGQQDDEARHLDTDHDAELYGTVDMSESIEEGIPWVPPETPTPEGEDGTEPENDADRDSF